MKTPARADDRILIRRSTFAKLVEAIPDDVGHAVMREVERMIHLSNAEPVLVRWCIPPQEHENAAQRLALAKTGVAQTPQEVLVVVEEEEEEEEEEAARAAPIPKPPKHPKPTRDPLLSPHGHEGMKRCSMCKEVKELVGAFARKTPTEGGPAAGHIARCRTCDAASMRAAYLKRKARGVV